MTLLKEVMANSPQDRKGLEEAVRDTGAALAACAPQLPLWQRQLTELGGQRQRLQQQLAQGEQTLKAKLASAAAAELEAAAAVLAGLENQELQLRHDQQQLQLRVNQALQLERHLVDLKRQLSLLVAAEGLQKMEHTLQPLWPKRQGPVKATLQQIREREAQGNPTQDQQAPASAASVLARLKGERP